MFNVNDRQVKVVTGRKTQTVNVCTTQNQNGVYDYILRLRPPFVTEEQLQSHSFASITDLVQHLQQNYNADVEKSPNKISLPTSSPTAQPNECQPTATSQAESTWQSNAKTIVEAAIDQLILDFVAFPFLHRVEHSIHCELFRILKSHTLFATTYPMGRYTCQSVHKEWPEYVIRPEKQGCGNFDICIIAPEELESATYDAFRKGYLRPFIAIEMGLDYKLNHLEQDADKLRNSGILNSYLVHLVRDVVDNFGHVEDFIIQSPFKTAYARIEAGRAFYKLVNGTDIQHAKR